MTCDLDQGMDQVGEFVTGDVRAVLVRGNLVLWPIWDGILDPGEMQVGKVAGVALSPEAEGAEVQVSGLAPLARESVLGRQPYLSNLYRMHAVDSATGPLLVLLLSDVEPNVGVYDAVTGLTVNWFTGLDHEYSEDRVATHVFQRDGCVVLAIAPDGDPIRQWALPGGERHPVDIVPGGPVRALTSYQTGDRTVLVAVDVYGVIRRFDAVTGAPFGDPIRLPDQNLVAGPGAVSRLLARINWTKPSRFHGGKRQVIACDPWSAEPTLLLASKKVVWRVALDSGAVTWTIPDPPMSVNEIACDPRPGHESVLIVAETSLAVLGSAARCQFNSGDFPYPELVAVVAAGDTARMYTSLGAEVVSWDVGAETPYRTVLDPVGADENHYIEDLCVLPVGERTALFVADGAWIYRYDAVTGEPWPAVVP